MIELKNITKVYQSQDNKIIALDNINLEIKKGEIFGVIGFSGAGKSSLIRSINFLEKPTSGSMIIDGVELNSLNNKELRNIKQSIGMIFQHFNLLSSKTVYENVALPLKLMKMKKKEIDKRVYELLEFVGLVDKAGSFPKELSGGQKQRVGIARALCTQPKILLCDEATSALDPKTTKQILNLLRKVNKEYEITIVMITHEMEVIRELCTKVAVLESGKVVEVGEVFKIFSKPTQEATKNFINDDSNFALPSYIKDKARISSNKLYSINFIGDNISNPVLSDVSRHFNININILYGNITELQSIPYGVLVVSFETNQKEVELAMDYIKKQNIEIKEVVC